MRQHVNPLSKNFHAVEVIPPLNEIFENPKLPLHLDVGCASGGFLFDLASENKNWNYLGIEIREKLVNNAKLKLLDSGIRNLFFSFGNVNNIFNNDCYKFIVDYMSSISFNFPDPWFKKKHYKRRVIQPDLISLLSSSMNNGSLIYIKTDVRDLYEYMDLTISSNFHFQKINSADFEYYRSFNPSKIQTNREKYVISNRLKIFERIYMKSD